jgi:hypothetical protein
MYYEIFRNTSVFENLTIIDEKAGSWKGEAGRIGEGRTLSKA